MQELAAVKESKIIIDENDTEMEEPQDEKKSSLEIQEVQMS